MNWNESICKAVEYIESNLSENISVTDIARYSCISPFYFQRGFAAVCGITVGEYIRRRRLSLAGNDLLATNEKIIDIALKYGYDSPDSFTKAFFRFHGYTPSDVRKKGVMIKNYTPFSLKATTGGSYIMNYKIVKKPAFTVAGYTKSFKYETAPQEVPVFWQDYFKTGKDKYICGMYGINADINIVGDTFEYMIAEDCSENKEYPSDVTVRTIPSHTWAVFACKGPSSQTIGQINKEIFTQWLPNCREYEIAEGYNIEMYTDASDYSNGVMDENYYGEIWIPIKKK